MGIKNTSEIATLTLAELAAREGLGLYKWVNDKVPGAVAVVLTDATLVYNIPAGYQVFIVKTWALLQTASDSCKFTTVSCSAINGGGVATALDGDQDIYSSGNLAGAEHYERDYQIPLVVKYSTGARSITIEVTANDALATIGCGWHGWVEPEL